MTFNKFKIKFFFICLFMVFCLFVISSKTMAESDTVDPNDSDFFPIALDNILPDCVVVIHNVQVLSRTKTSATISWETPYTNTTGKINYGLTANYGMSKSTSDIGQQTHSLSLSGLNPNTTYHFQIEAKSPSTDTVILSDDSTFRTLVDNIDITHSGRWLGENRAEIVFSTDRPATATLKYWSSSSDLQWKYFQTTYETQFRHEFPVETDRIYYYQISVRGEGTNPPTSGVSGNFRTPLTVYINHSATPTLINAATQDYDVTFTWSTAVYNGPIAGTGTVNYQGTSSGSTSCLESNSTCTTTVHNIKPGSYTYTIIINIIDPRWDASWLNPFAEGTLQIAAINFRINANGTNGMYPDGYSVYFDIQSSPEVNMRDGTITGEAITRELNPETGQYVTYTACPVQTNFSGLHPTQIRLQIPCHGMYTFYGSAVIYDGVSDRQIPLNVMVENQYFNGEASSASYLNPFFSGITANYDKPVAFPWKVSPIRVYKSLTFGNWTIVKYVHPQALTGTPPTNIVVFDRLTNGESAINSGEWAWVIHEYPNSSVCPGQFITDKPDGWDDGDPRYDVCMFQWR